MGEGRNKPPVRQESAPRKFESLHIPGDLLGKKMGVVQTELKKRSGFAGRLATTEDLDYIKANPDQFPNLKDGKWHNAFGSKVQVGGGQYVPCVSWNGGLFYRDDRWVANHTDGYDRVLLRA